MFDIVANLSIGQLVKVPIFDQNIGKFGFPPSLWHENPSQLELRVIWVYEPLIHKHPNLQVEFDFNLKV